MIGALSSAATPNRITGDAGQQGDAAPFDALLAGLSTSPRAAPMTGASPDAVDAAAADAEVASAEHRAEADPTDIATDAAVMLVGPIILPISAPGVPANLTTASESGRASDGGTSVTMHGRAQGGLQVGAAATDGNAATMNLPDAAGGSRSTGLLSSASIAVSPPIAAAVPPAIDAVASDAHANAISAGGIIADPLSASPATTAAALQTDDVAPLAPAEGVAVALAYPRPSLPPHVVSDRARGRTATSDPTALLPVGDIMVGQTTPIMPDMTQFAALSGSLSGSQPMVATQDAGGSLPGASAPDAAIQHHLDMAHDGAWLDRLARDIAASADKEGRMRFQLNPERLGSLHVEIAPGAQGSAVRFTTESETARALIADAQPQLVAEARAQGMRITDTQVDLSSRSDGRGEANAFTHAQQQQQQQNQSGGQRVPLFDRPATAMTRSANGLSADSPAVRAERYA